MDDKQKKVDTGKALLDSYQREKHEKVHGRGGDSVVQTETYYDSYSKVPSGKHETKRDRLDAVTLHKKTAQFESLKTTIKELQDAVSEKSEIINALKIENGVLRNGRGDSPNTPDTDNSKMVKKLQELVDARDIYIAQLSKSLQQRSDELEQSTLREKDRIRELHELHQKMDATTKQYELKLSESFNEAIESKGKSEQLGKQIIDYSDLVRSLRVDLEASSKKVDSLQEELDVKNKKMDQYKNKCSQEIQELMKQVQDLNCVLSRKEKEVHSKNKEIENIQNEMEMRFGSQLTILKKEMEKKYSEDIRKVERLYDDMLLNQLRNPSEDNRVVEKCNELESQISSCKLECEEQVETYKRELEGLILKSKSAEEKLIQEMDLHRSAADHYRQQVENVENKLSEEVQKVKNECYLELEKLDVKCKRDQELLVKYQQEISKLSFQLKEYAVRDAQVEVEAETYRDQLAKSEAEINTLIMSLNQYKQAFEEQTILLSQLQNDMAHSKSLINQYRSAEEFFKQNEEKLQYELKMSRAKVLEYEHRVLEFNKKMAYDSEQLNEKYNAVVNTLQRKVEEDKALYQSDLSRLSSVTIQQKEEIKRLEAQIASVIESAKSEGGELKILNDLSEPAEIDSIKQRLLSANKVIETDKKCLLSILKRLKKVKSNINAIMNFNSDQNLSEKETTEGEVDDTTYSLKELVLELEKMVCDIQNETSMDSVNNFTPTSPSNHKVVTSTPHVKNGIGLYVNSEDLNDQFDIDQDTCDNCLGWRENCVVFKKEKENYEAKLISVLENQKEMEYCLLLATQEAASFNEKCLSLDAKITELERSKLSHHLLKRENYDLRTQIIALEKNEQKLQQELQKAGENYIKLQQMFNVSISDLQKQLSENKSNLELQQILLDLTAKSEEVVLLKTQLTSLQQSEQKFKTRASELQNKYEQFITKHEFLESELNKNVQELDSVLQDRNRLTSENKVLQTKLKCLEDKIDTQHKVDYKADGLVFEDKLREGELNRDLSSLSVSRLQTMDLLSANRSLSNNSLSKSITSPQSLADKIQSHLLELEQEPVGHNYLTHMPTIPEDGEEEITNSPSPRTNNGALQEKKVDGRKIKLLENKCEKALKYLLSALFDEYCITLKKLHLWMDEFDTLNLNLVENSSSILKENETLSSNIVEQEFCLNPVNLQLVKTLDPAKRLVEGCIRSILYLKIRLIAAHEFVLSSINVQKDELHTAGLVHSLRAKVNTLEAEMEELSKNHKSAIELLIKDHKTQLGFVHDLLSKIQNGNTEDVRSHDLDETKRELEEKYKEEVEELRSYYEKKYKDLLKNYSEEVYSQSQQSKVSMSSSSSDIENMCDLYYPTGEAEDEANQLEETEGNHDICNKQIVEYKDLLESMKAKYKTEIETVQSDYELKLKESVCKLCKRTLKTGDEPRSKSTGISLDQYYAEKIKDLGEKYSSSDITKDLELKVYQIKEEVRKEYEGEMDKMREEIISKELQRKDEEIKLMKTQLNESHKLEIEKMWQRYEELASKEAENSMMRVKNEVVLSQELEEKSRLIEKLNCDLKDLERKIEILNEERKNELDQINQAKRKEAENMKQVFGLELATRVETVLEEKNAVEEKLKKEISMLRDNLKRMESFNKNCQLQQNQEKNVQHLTDSLRGEILHSLEEQIKAMVEGAEEGKDDLEWPPELVSLERVFAAKYQKKLSQLVQEHALEIAEINTENSSKLASFIRDYTLKQTEEMDLCAVRSEDEDIELIIRERDSLRGLVMTLRQIVQELARYMTSCENQLNKSFLGALLHVSSPQRESKVEISEVDCVPSDSDCDNEAATPKRVHFAPDVSTIVSLLDEDSVFDNSVDMSIHLRSELENCLDRLRSEAASVLGLTQAQNRGLPSTVGERRLSSVTRQLIEEKKAKEEANNKLVDLQQLVEKYEKELHEVHKELMDTKDSMIKEKIAVETEFNERQAERKIHKLSLLQEKARSLLVEREDCPPQWLNLIEELFGEGDTLIEEAWRARDELQLEVEAADKQLKSTRAFLEEQASEREQERDEYTREIERLTEMLRDKEREWTNHRQLVSEQCDETPASENMPPAYNTVYRDIATVDALEQQVRETSELLKDTEENKTKLEKELKAANDKIWVLRDIITELEVQVSARCEHAVTLERRVAELETELDKVTEGQTHMLGELQALRNSSGDHAQAQLQLSSLHDQLQGQKHNSALVVRHMKSQLRGIGRSLERQIKELEMINIHVSTASLSSPSEDVSIREHLEALRCATPEERPGSGGSPPSMIPVEEINQLNEKLVRYSRAAENLIKMLRDREMEIHLLRNQQEELQAERDVAQNQTEKQVLQLASLNNKLDELRRRNQREVESCVEPLHQHIQQLENQISQLSNQLRETQRQSAKMKLKLDRSEAMVQSREAELSSLSQQQQAKITHLHGDLAALKAEKQQLQAMVNKFQQEENVSFPHLIETMLAEKNADIDQLEKRVEELMNQQEMSAGLKSENQHSKSGNRVSFADEVLHSHLAEGERVRDAPVEPSTLKPFFSTPLSSIEEKGSKFVPRTIGEDLSKIPHPIDIHSSTISDRTVNEIVLSQLKSELEQKSVRLMECESQLKELPILEQELNKTKEELLETVKSVCEDKSFYEEQLKSLSQTKQLLVEKENELEKIKRELEEKDKEIVKTTADVRALQIIMDGLQQKLQEAKSFADTKAEHTKSINLVELENDKLKNECEHYKATVVRLQEQMTEVNDAFLEEMKSRQELQAVVDELGKCKQEIVNELIDTKNRSESLKKELDRALERSEEQRLKLEHLSAELEGAEEEKKSLKITCQKLKKEVDQLNKKQRVEMKNILRKDSEEALKLKEELELLRSNNSELQSECSKLQQELSEVGNDLDLLKEIDTKDEKIAKMQVELQKLETSNKLLDQEKSQTEQELNLEISGLKSLIDDLNKSMALLETESKDSEDKQEYKDNLVKKYEILKREYERQRRARRESEKKCSVLKSELAKEKQFTARLQNKIEEKKNFNLEVSKADIVDIRSETLQPAGSIDNLADQVQQELNASAQLDQTLLSGLQSEASEESRSDKLPVRVEYLTARLAEVETALHVEKVVVSELRAKLITDHNRFMEQKLQTEELRQQVTTLHTLNDQLEDKFKSIAYQLQEQVDEVKELRLNITPENSNTPEKQKLKQLAEENQRRVDELLKEREFNKNQLLYLREELSKMWSERDRNKDDRSVKKENNLHTSQLNNLQQALEVKKREVEQEQKRCTALQRLLEQANLTTDQQNQQLSVNQVHIKDLRSKNDELKQKLIHETGVRKALEAKMKMAELSEKNRLTRRKVLEDQLRDKLAQANKEKKELERECLSLQLKLKHSNLQLVAHTAESPLSLRLRETNLVIERLVSEKEDLSAANTMLKDEKHRLQKQVCQQATIIEDLKCQITALNVKVVDGGMDNLNAMFAAERDAWMREKESLKLALAQKYTVSGDSFNSFNNSAHILQRYLKAESHRKALVWQKRYLMLSLKAYQEEERHTVMVLSRANPTSVPPPAPAPSPLHKFRVAVCAVRTVSRLQFLVDHRKKSQENTIRLLRHAINHNGYPRKTEFQHIPAPQSLWRRTDIASSTNSLHGNMSQLMEQFNLIQDRIKNTLTT